MHVRKLDMHDSLRDMLNFFPKKRRLPSDMHARECHAILDMLAPALEPSKKNVRHAYKKKVFAMKIHPTLGFNTLSALEPPKKNAASHAHKTRKVS